VSICKPVFAQFTLTASLYVSDTCGQEFVAMLEQNLLDGKLSYYNSETIHWEVIKRFGLS